MIIQAVIVLGIPLIILFFFWSFAIKRNWWNLNMLALSGAITLLLVSALAWLLTSTAEIWILEVGVTYAVWVGLMILSIPLIAPDTLKKLGIKRQPPSKIEIANGLEKFFSENQPFIGSVLLFFYLMIGYVATLYFRDPKTFIFDLQKQWWILIIISLFVLLHYIDARKNKASNG